MPWVYKHFDKDNRLLYVGLTGRHMKYRAKKSWPWLDEINFIELNQFHHLGLARHYERFAIEEYAPIYNKQWNARNLQ